MVDYTTKDLIDKKIDGLFEYAENLAKQNEQLRKDSQNRLHNTCIAYNTTMENKGLRIEIDKLKKENEALKAENKELRYNNNNIYEIYKKEITRFEQSVFKK